MKPDKCFSNQSLSVLSANIDEFITMPVLPNIESYANDSAFLARASGSDISTTWITPLDSWFSWADISSLISSKVFINLSRSDGGNIALAASFPNMDSVAEASKDLVPLVIKPLTISPVASEAVCARARRILSFVDRSSSGSFLISASEITPLIVWPMPARDSSKNSFTGAYCSVASNSFNSFFVFSKANTIMANCVCFLILSLDLSKTFISSSNISVLRLTKFVCIPILSDSRTILYSSSLICFFLAFNNLPSSVNKEVHFFQSFMPEVVLKISFPNLFLNKSIA